MRRLMLDGPGAVRWEEHPEPEITGPGQAVVRPVAVATCDIDPAVLTGVFPLAGPYPFGHEGVGEVVSVGADVRKVRPGDLVVVPFQISCGACGPCTRGRTGNCAAHPMMSTYGLGPMGGLGWGGLLADLALVPHADAMLVHVPPGVAAETVASASDNIPDAYRAVAPHLAAEPGAEVLVVGGSGPSSIGLYAAGLAVALGAARVVYLDHDPDRLGIAAALGADTREGGYEDRLGAFPITVDASGAHEGLRRALRSTAPDGVCTSVSVYLKDPPLPMFQMYSRCCTLHTGRAHVRPAIPQVLDLVARGRFDPSLVTTTLVDWEDAPEALPAAPLKLVATRTGTP
ncbi:dehydrogenase [Actinomadura craniellae]|uniref:Dehydrogenase n=1 Tax=Actinomadura craniellae TaxID=2231787 RepID=A0A365H3R9_9ACTN|nr:alcohol dehydrogenase catalytic domain-containing protein [Actinomadura craniellae]RAY13747.1 dehydrogenase [Actinomadura craniellae]